MGSKGILTWRKPSLKPIDTSRIGQGKDAAKNGHEDLYEEEPLSPSARLFHEPNFNVHIIAIMGSKTLVDLDIVRSRFPGTMLKHPRFSSLQVVDEKTEEMRWVPTKVDLDNHIIAPKIDEEALANPDKFVEDYISSLTKTAIPMSQPLWDLHVLNIPTKDAAALGVFRIHHSLGDGTSLMSLLLACARQAADPTALPTLPTHKKRVGKEKGGAFRFGVGFRWAWRLVLSLWWVVELFWNSVVDVVMFMATAMFLRDTRTPLTSPPGVENLPRRFIWKTVSFDDMKLIKNAMNAIPELNTIGIKDDSSPTVTINDVALGITQAALSRYLNRKYGDPEKDNLPKNIRLRSTLLINIRPVSGIQALADMMEKGKEARWGNWIGFVLLPFTIGLRKDPLDYVRQAKATVDRKKRSLEAIWTFSIAKIVLDLFGIKKSSAMSNRIIANTTLCFSNLVGPLEEIQFHGHELLYLAPSSFNQPHALMINFQSYTNKMTVVLSFEEETIPDAHQLLDDIVDCLKLIKDAVIAKGLAN